MKTCNACGLRKADSHFDSPDARFCKRCTDERNYWREQYLAASRREVLLNARISRLLSLHHNIRDLTP